MTVKPFQFLKIKIISVKHNLSLFILLYSLGPAFTF